MRVLKILLPLLVLAIGAGGYYYFKKNKTQPDPIEAVVRLPVVSAISVKKVSVSPTLSLFGSVESPNNTVLTAGITADVLRVKALEGEFVTAGTVLIELDDSDMALEVLQRNAEIAEIEAQLDSDRKRYAADKAALGREKALLELSRKAVERNRTLAQTSAGTQATLDSARQQEEQQKLAITQRQLSIDDFDSRQALWKARLEKAQAVHQKTIRDQARTIVKAPFDGRVVKVMVSVGDRTVPGGSLLQLYDVSSLEIRAQVPSRYLSRLQQALAEEQAIHATMNGNQKPINLVLHRLAASVSDSQGGVDAFFRATDGALPALGKTIAMQLKMPVLQNAVVLTPDALYGADRIYKVVDGELTAVQISRLGQTIDQSGRQFLVLDGRDFVDGEQVLTSRLPQAIDGLKVEIQELTVGGE